jgi:hypothetical protein
VGDHSGSPGAVLFFFALFLTMKKLCTLILAFWGAVISATDCSNQLDLIQSYLSGVSSNWEQVNEEIRNGNQIHPYLIHKFGKANSKIKNLPYEFAGFFAIEERYSLTASGSRNFTSLLLSFQTLSNRIQITSYLPPVPLEELKNDNQGISYPFSYSLNCFFKDLVIDFNKLIISPIFPQKFFTFRENEDGCYFQLAFENNVTQNNQAISFSLNETVTSQYVSSLEVFLVNGVNVITWNTPVKYQKLVNVIFTFDELMSAVKSHQQVKLVNYYWWCALNSSMEDSVYHLNENVPSQVDAVGSQIIDTWEYFGSYPPEPYLAFSESKFIDHPKYG